MYHDGRLQAGQIGSVMAEGEAKAFDDNIGEESDLDKVIQARIEEINGGVQKSANSRMLGQNWQESNSH